MLSAFEVQGVAVYHADCLDVLPTLSGVDAVVTDPPYGIGYANNRRDIRPWMVFTPVVGDKDRVVGQAAIDSAFGQGWPVCAFASPRRPWVGDWRQFLVWDKGDGVGAGGDRATCWKFNFELVQVGGFGRLNGPRDGSVLRFPVGGGAAFRLHPTQKPVALMRYLIGKLTAPGALVLDPFAGSGSTGVACIKTGRRCILIEKDAQYLPIIERRLREASSPLFDRLPALAGGG